MNKKTLRYIGDGILGEPPFINRRPFKENRSERMALTDIIA